MKSIKHIIATLVLAITMVGAWAAAPYTIQQVDNARIAGDWARAEQMTEAVVRDNPNNAKAVYYLAQFRNHAGDYPAALKRMNEAQRIDPTLSFANKDKFNQLKNELLTRRDRDLAARDARIAAAVTPVVVNPPVAHVQAQAKPVTQAAPPVERSPARSNEDRTGDHSSGLGTIFLWVLLGALVIGGILFTLSYRAKARERDTRRRNCLQSYMSLQSEVADTRVRIGTADISDDDTNTLTGRLRVIDNNINDALVVAKKRELAEDELSTLEGNLRTRDKPGLTNIIDALDAAKRRKRLASTPTPTVSEPVSLSKSATFAPVATAEAPAPNPNNSSTAHLREVRDVAPRSSGSSSTRRYYASGPGPAPAPEVHHHHHHHDSGNDLASTLLTVAAIDTIAHNHTAHAAPTHAPAPVYVPTPVYTPAPVADFDDGAPTISARSRWDDGDTGSSSSSGSDWDSGRSSSSSSYSSWDSGSSSSSSSWDSSSSSDSGSSWSD